MSRKVILLGPLPPPFGGVSVYLSLLFERLRGRAAVGVWAYYGDEAYAAREEGVRLFRHRRLGVVPLMLRGGYRARVLDATHFHLEHPHVLLLPVWLVLKHLLRVRWYKNVHDGSLPARHKGFKLTRRLLFRMAVSSVDEFVVVSEELRRWLRDEIKVRQPINVVPSLLPVARERPVEEDEPYVLARLCAHALDGAGRVRETVLFDEDSD